jgi:site-specific DNA-adenine methylase
VRRGLEKHHLYPDPLIAACKIFLHHATRSGSGKGKLATWKRHAVGWYTPPASWDNKRRALPEFATRLQGVTIREMDLFEALQSYPSEVVYVDPPYDGSKQHGSVDHARLAAALHSLPGARLITHYRTAKYDDLYRDWSRDDFRLGNQFSGQGKAGKTRIKVESLYYAITLGSYDCRAGTPPDRRGRAGRSPALQAEE